MRTLPKNVYVNSGGGWIVRIKRGAVKFTACVPFGLDRDASLAQAVALRDRFYARHGKFALAPARSNTGITGITEVTKWFHSRPYDCFQVTATNPRRGGMKRFYYKGETDRTRALRAAVSHRARVTGLSEERITAGVTLS